MKDVEWNLRMCRFERLRNRTRAAQGRWAEGDDELLELVDEIARKDFLIGKKNEAARFAASASCDLWYKHILEDSKDFESRMLPADLKDLNHDEYGSWVKFRHASYQAEWLYQKIGMPSWYVDKNVFELLESCTIDEDVSGVNFTHDTFTLVFERGQTLCGIPILSIQVSYVRSDFGRSLILKHFGEIDERLSDFIMCDVSLGVFACPVAGEARQTLDMNLAREYAVAFDNEFLLDDLKYGRSFELYRSPKSNNSNTLGACEKFNLPEPDAQKCSDAMDAAFKIACAAMLYRDARPDLVVPYTLPRNQRYNVKGDRSGICRAMLPTAKTIRHGSAPSLDGQPSRTVRPHYRGFVLRVLRSERYKRKEDGSFRTVLVEPCAIHPELMEES